MHGTQVQVVFDCHDPEALSGFWAEALHYQLQNPPSGFDSWERFLESADIPRERWNDASAIVDPAGVGPRVYFQRVPETKTVKNRMHLDLNISGGPALALSERRTRVDAEVRRLHALGATGASASTNDFGNYWVVMQDP